MSVHKPVLAVLAAATVLSLSACQDGGASGTPSTPPTTSASSAGSATASSPAPTGAAPSTTTDHSASPVTQPPAAGALAKCRTADLDITASDRTITGEGEGTVVVTLKNRSSKDCTVAGYAGVDLQTSAGAISAQRSGQPASQAVLKSGKPTFVGIYYPLNTSGGTGVRITGLVVTPPDETQSVTLPWPGAASLPVTDTSGGDRVRISPIGGEGQGEG
ncbi:uncharacterized protein DUF4232 [Kitasatospora sp. SolWspMP-SS2h]|uniref:DUF4232 domain-containing protein n=1 Tax=Kitasatospora sp. SolWspMP-SS2h TaxID=1305729 RepID=UPI000DBACDBF|nr:DUF4232 domain-containing protein [Kitasatospora sp. SolWspMP-SS2h]RAJ29827.1 uncharacterized protein DUF4232 [Kitasatospora sp. SolWspMP-SS2h]